MSSTCLVRYHLCIYIRVRPKKRKISNGYFHTSVLTEQVLHTWSVCKVVSTNNQKSKNRKIPCCCPTLLVVLTPYIYHCNWISITCLYLLSTQSRDISRYCTDMICISYVLLNTCSSWFPAWMMDTHL